jgi:hypothetical protein
MAGPGTRNSCRFRDVVLVHLNSLSPYSVLWLSSFLNPEASQYPRLLTFTLINLYVGVEKCIVAEGCLCTLAYDGRSPKESRI